MKSDFKEKKFFYPASFKFFIIFQVFMEPLIISPITLGNMIIYLKKNVFFESSEDLDKNKFPKSLFN